MLQSLQHFKHIDAAVLSIIIKQSILQCEKFPVQSIAIVCNALADLGINNQNLFTKVKEVLMTRLFPSGGERLAGDAVKAIDSATIMTAYCRLNLYDNELFYSLESVFFDESKQQLTPTEITAKSLVTMYCAHQTWASFVMDQTLNINRDRKGFKEFREYSAVFNQTTLAKLEELKSEMDLNSYFMVMSHTKIANLNSKHAARIVIQLAIDGLPLLKQQVHTMLGRNIGKVGEKNMEHLYALVDQEMDETTLGATEEELV